MRAFWVLSAAALALAACGYPDPNAYPRTDRFLGVTGQVFTPPQAPAQTVYCYRNLGRSTDCTPQPLPGQDYRLVNAYVAPPPPAAPGVAPPPAPVPPPASPAALDTAPRRPTSVAPPPPATQTPTPAPGPARNAGAPPLSLRPSGPPVGDPPPPEPPAAPPS